MIVVIWAGFAALTLLLAIYLVPRIRWARRRRVLELAQDSGVVLDENCDIDARATLDGMRLHEQKTGRQFTGREARFMELMRVVVEGPETVEDMRLLFSAGIQPIVRPDGVVYVPTPENEHLSTDGDLELAEADLDCCVRNGIVRASNCA